MLEPGGNVHSVSEDVTVLENHFTQVKTHPKSNPHSGLTNGFRQGNFRLQAHRALEALPYGIEDREEPVAGILDDMATGPGDQRVDDLVP